MKYSIFKDEKPQITAEKIKDILKNNNLKIEEHCIFLNNNDNSPVSLRAALFGIDIIGTNGKGTNIDNARASAYAEFMERLQNQFLIELNGTDYNWAPDEIMTDYTDMYNDLNKKQDLLYLLNISKNILENGKANNVFNKSDDCKFLLIPFYSVKDEKAINLPIKVINILLGSNGMAAGNSLEEAIVQGLSEICERYSMFQIIKNKISMPDIPSELYMKYDNIKNMIEYYENNGYKLHIKDASLNKKLPVVCLIAEDKENNIFYMNFGAQPSLPVAIERTLTELSQGVDLKDKSKVLNSKKLFNFYSKSAFNFIKNHINYLCERFALYGGSFEYNEYLNQQFFENKNSYEFSSDAWINNDDKPTNKELLNFIMNNIKDITNNDIYIRDVSFLGFPSVQIFIPEMSVIKQYNNENIAMENNLYKWSKYDGSNNSPYNDIESLKTAVQYRLLFGIAPYYLEISMLPDEYIALLCSIITKETKNIELYADILIERNNLKKEFNEKGILRIKIIKDFYTQNKSYEELNKIYSKEDIQNFRTFVNNLSFDYIKQLILKYKVKKTKSEKEIILEQLQPIINNLHKKYTENTPIQTNVKQVFS